MKANCILRAVFYPTLAGSLLLAGCGGSGFGESVTLPQARTHRIDGGLKAGQAILFPVDVPFNVADAQRYSTGNAEASSTASDGGSASCRVATTGGGSAWAEFQVGQVVYNATDAPLPVDILFDCQYEYSLAEPPSDPTPTPTLGLKLLVQDSNRRILKQSTLVDASGTLSAELYNGRESPSYAIVLEPHLAYNLLAAARAEVSEASHDGDCSGRIAIKNLLIEVHARHGHGASTEPSTAPATR